MILFSIPISGFVKDWMYTAEDAVLIVETGSTIETENAHDVEIIINQYPSENERQHIISTETFPETTNYSFQWQQAPDNLSFLILSHVQTMNKQIKVDKKIPFPLEEEFDFYMHSTDTIDFYEPAITNQAAQLAQGEDDLYVLVFKVASWIEQNIAYSLETITINASQPASWVLENKKGVCDEVTNLFIAYMRALGIPARFVSGYAYTSETYFSEPWGPHGWAEVYFPGYGWVPVDITYKQIGWIDLSHVQLQEAEDALAPSVLYSWSGGTLDPQPVQTHVKPVSVGKNKTDQISYTASVMHDAVGFGSYNLLEVVFDHDKPYYQQVTISLAGTESLHILDDTSQMILLKPHEKKKLYLLFQIQHDLDPRFVYTSFIHILADSVHEYIEVTSSKEDHVYEKDDFPMQVIQSDQKKTTADTDENIEIICTGDKEVMYLNEELLFQCSIENSGKRKIDFSLCYEDCQSMELDAFDTYESEFNYKPYKAGKQDLKVSIRGEDLLEISVVPIAVLPLPSIHVTADCPSSITFEVTAECSLSFDSSLDPVHDVSFTISMNDRVLNKEFIPSLESTQSLLLIPGKLMNPGKNTVIISFTFTDQKGNVHLQDELFEIYLRTDSIWQNMIIRLRNIVYSITGLFS